jgi:hypothetical protein
MICTFHLEWMKSRIQIYLIFFFVFYRMGPLVCSNSELTLKTTKFVLDIQQNSYGSRIFPLQIS